MALTSTKLVLFSAIFAGIIIYSADGLRCLVCVPMATRVPPEEKFEADVLRNEIERKYGGSKECDNTPEWKAQIGLDQYSMKECTGSDPWCYLHSTSMWSARTCRNTPPSQGCQRFGSKSDCYCNNMDGCNAASGLRVSFISIASVIVYALATFPIF